MDPISGARLPEGRALGSHTFVTLSSAHLFVTLLTIILASLPPISLLKQIRTPVSASHGKEDRDIVHFVEDISKLIGGSAIALFRKGIEECNTEHNTTVRFDPKTDLSDKESSEDILSYYFESLVGPVCRRVYEESKAEKKTLRSEQRPDMLLCLMNMLDHAGVSSNNSFSLSLAHY